MAKGPTSDKAAQDEDVSSRLWIDQLRSRGAAIGKKTGYRIYRLGGELLSVLLALGMVALFFAASLLTRQEADLTSLRPAFERWFSQSFGGAEADLETLRLQWNPSEKTVTFMASDITVYDQDGTIVQTLERLEATTTRENLLNRRASIRDVRVVGGEVSWVETESGEIIAGLGNPETVGGVGPIYQGATEASDRRQFGWLEEFRSLTLSGTRLHVQRASDGLSLSADLDQLSGRFDGETAELEVQGHLKNSQGLEGGSVSVDLSLDDRFNWQRLSVQAESLVPGQLAPPSGRLSVLRAFDLPLTITLQAENSTSGLQSASVNLLAEPGRLILAGEGQGVESVLIQASLDPGEEEMTVRQFDVVADRLNLNASGIVTEIGRIQDGDVSTSPKFDLDVQQARLDATPMFEAPIEVETANVIGELDLDSRTLTLDDLAARFDGFSIGLSGVVQTNDEGLSRLELAGQTQSAMTAPQLLTLWPVKAADGARRWIDRSVLDGTLHNVVFDINLDEAFFETPDLADDHLQLTFEVEDGVVKYISTMDPLVEAKGSGRIAGNRFGFVLEEGAIGDIEIIGGDVDIPRLTPKGGDILITANASGDLGSLMRLIDQPPFEYLKRYGANPEGFGGEALVTLNIKRPLLEYFDEDRIEYSVSGTFDDAKSPFKFGSYTLDQGDLTIEGGKDGLFLTGDANLGPWRANLSWAERYGQNGEPTRYRISGPMDRKTLDAFGIGLREFFGGEIDVDIEAEGTGLNVSDAFATIDLTNAEIAFGDVWSKSAGETGEVRLEMRREGEVVSFPRVAMVAPGLDLEGGVFLRSNFALEEARLDKAKIDGLMDGRLVLSRDDEAGRLKIAASGRSLDISDFSVNAIRQAGGSSLDLPIAVEAEFDEIVVGPDYPLGGAKLAYRHDGEIIEFMSLSGKRPSGPLDVKIEAIEDGLQSSKISVPDVSQMATSLLGLDTLEGGRMTLNATLPPPDVDLPALGSVEVEDFRVRNAPFLAQILSLASLTGFVETLSGEGLSFDELSFDFGMKNQRLTVRDAKLRGPALGMTGQGEIDLSVRSIDFGGTLVPAYTANSILQDIPLFGDLLVGQDGEGIFAVTYTIDGPFSQALVTINPLSALTPGFIRGIFRENREDLPENMAEAIEDQEAEASEQQSD